MPVTIGGSGPITGVTSINTTVSDTELGYLDGVSSALQTQINGKGTYTDWTSYTPTITTAGGSFTLGNGTLTADYCRVGNMVTVRVEVVWGSTTSATGGAWRISTPIVGSGVSLGPAWILDTGLRYYIAIARGGTNGIEVFSSTTNNAEVTGTSPMTWTNGDVLQLIVTYKAA